MTNDDRDIARPPRSTGGTNPAFALQDVQREIEEAPHDRHEQ
jgi:hypothetical protein